MTDQPPAQPPAQPPVQPHQPSETPPQGGPATQPMPSVAKTNAWHQATSTRGGRWAVAVAGSLIVLMLLGIVVSGFLLLRSHDRSSMMGQRQGMSRDQGDQGNGQPGRHPGMNGGRSPLQRGMPGAPGMRGGAQGQGGLGSLLTGTLHGNVTAMVNGSVQALLVQRGQVTAVSATSITLKSSDGFVGTYVRNATTKANGLDPVKGGQALVLARASDKVAWQTMVAPSGKGGGPGN